MDISTWWNCYDDGWGDELVPEAFSHPAKFSRGLIRNIYKHAIDEGWIRDGDFILDPFGGVGLGGIDATRNGLQWVGLDLEQDFVIIGSRNFANLASKEWCTCGKHGQTYLRSMRESFRAGSGRSKPKEEVKERPVLFPVLSDSLEQGQGMAQEDTGETFCGGQRGKSRIGKEWELEGWTRDQAGWLRDCQGEWETKNGARSFDGTTPGTDDETKRSRSSRERKQAGQPDRESKSNDPIRSHEATSSRRNQAQDNAKDLCCMRKDVPGEASLSYLQSAMQAAEKSRILAKARRQAEGKYCQTCGKLIVAFPVLLQGDSRNLLDVIGAENRHWFVRCPICKGDGIARIDGSDAGTCIACDGAGHVPVEAGRAAGVVASPPFSNSLQAQDDKFYRDRMVSYGRGKIENLNKTSASTGDYGHAPGNLGNLRATEAGFDAAIASPPYAGQELNDCQRHAKNGALFTQPQTYGHSPGQLGSMPAGDFDAAVSSPPYEGSLQGGKGGIDYSKSPHPEKFTDHSQGVIDMGYSIHGDNIGNSNGDDFWSAARIIVQQTYAALRPGGHAIWVVKSFVRNKQIVDFPGQPHARLCAHVGPQVALAGFHDLPRRRLPFCVWRFCLGRGGRWAWAFGQVVNRAQLFARLAKLATLSAHHVGYSILPLGLCATSAQPAPAAFGAGLHTKAVMVTAATERARPGPFAAAG